MYKESVSSPPLFWLTHFLSVSIFRKSVKHFPSPSYIFTQNFFSLHLHYQKFHSYTHILFLTPTFKFFLILTPSHSLIPPPPPTAGTPPLLAPPPSPAPPPPPAPLRPSLFLSITLFSFYLSLFFFSLIVDSWILGWSNEEDERGWCHVDSEELQKVQYFVGFPGFVINFVGFNISMFWLLIYGVWFLRKLSTWNRNYIYDFLMLVCLVFSIIIN